MTHVRAHVRSMVRPMARGVIGSPYGGSSFHDGISYSAETGRVVIKAVGAAPTITTLASAFTFTGGNQSMYMGPAGLLVASATNTPRIEYDASGNCLGLLMEASRTNLYLQSQDFATSHSSVGLNAVTTNATTAPDGTLTADRISEDTSGSQHRIRQATDITITSGSTNTFSVFVKADQKTHVSLRLTENTFASAVECIFNLSAGTAGTPVNIGAASGGVARIQPAGNGWFRCSLTGAVNGGFLNCRALTELLDPTNTTITYTGGGTAGLFVWGGQFEAGAAFPSSYIPTTTASVDRTQDSCIRTLGSEFSATAGTALVLSRSSGGQATGAGGVWSFDDGTTNNRITLVRGANSDSARVNVTAGGAAQAQTDATITNSTFFKHATAWASNDVASSLNGATVLTDATVTVPTVTSLFIGGLASGFQGNCHVRRFDYWPTRLSNPFLVSASA